MAANSFRVRDRLDDHGISGQINFPAIAGLFVNFDPTDMVTPKLVKATGVKGFALRRTVLQTGDELAALQISRSVFPKSFLGVSEEVVGDHVTADKIIEAEYEGPNLVQYSGTGAISDATAAQAELGLNNGLLRVKQAGDALVGHLKAHLTPLDSDNDTRILVQFVL